jgi:four helix bundle protein
MEVFDHERLEVYRLALEVVVAAREIIERLPPGYADVSDQLARASRSVVLNTAEGAGEFSKKEKARFYRMAKRSATECAGSLDVCRVLHLADDKLLDAGRMLLLRIVSMHVRLVQSLDGPGTGRGTGTGTRKAKG